MVGCGPEQLAKRALVKVILALAAQFGSTVRITRDSPDSSVLSAHRAVCKTVHPDKGGSNTEFQELQAAKECWDEARSVKKKAVPSLSLLEQSL